jgi:epoxyqueuosine reductase
MTPEERGSLVRRLAREAGFDRVGLAAARPLEPEPFRRFFAEGLHADMAWLADERRTDPGKTLPGARTVAVVALSYFDPTPRPSGVSRYARGMDYHAVLRRKLRKLRKALEREDPGVRTYASVDWGPIAEKAWAERAGLGWIGKNGLLITRTHGSWVFLGALLLDRDCAPVDRPHADFCGSCTRCLAACPTGAFPRPRVVDSRRCLSYQTIEQRGVVPDAIKPGAGGWVFGCDDCQTCCPWNERFARPTAEARLLPREGALWDVPLDRLIRLDHAAWEGRARGTAVARAKHFGLVRNALIAAGNSGDPGLLPACAARLDDPHPAVADAAAWAVRRLGGDPAAPGERLPPCGAGLSRVDGEDGDS